MISTEIQRYEKHPLSVQAKKEGDEPKTPPSKGFTYVFMEVCNTTGYGSRTMSLCPRQRLFYCDFIHIITVAVCMPHDPGAIYTLPGTEEK
ncbi:hypothetical protein DVF53_24830 [Salmonella enterica subsp. enterica serovar Kottbus]|nr:hypothetical protein [Salmonella enterica subsp. enterica serovar Newport]EBY2753804.1 hypothetical protein [Salmonella enterica subsp. enterica serovar Kottbus]